MKHVEIKFYFINIQTKKTSASFPGFISGSFTFMFHNFCFKPKISKRYKKQKEKKMFFKPC